MVVAWATEKLFKCLKQNMDVFSESLTFFFFGQKQLISNVLLGKSTNYVFNSNIVLDCCVYRKAVCLSMFTCYYFLNFNTFINVLKNKSFEYWILCLLNCNSYHHKSNISLNDCLDKYHCKQGKGKMLSYFSVSELSYKAPSA